MDNLLDHVSELISLGDLVRPLAIRTAVRLRIFDHLRSTPIKVSTLARKINVDNNSLKRLLEALCNIGFLHVSAAKVYALTDMGHCLCSDHPLSMRDAFDLAETDVRAWTELDYSVRTGNSCYRKS